MVLWGAMTLSMTTLIITVPNLMTSSSQHNNAEFSDTQHNNSQCSNTQNNNTHLSGIQQNDAHYNNIQNDNPWLNYTKHYLINDNTEQSNVSL